MARRPARDPESLLIGVGFDGDGHRRVTTGRDFVVVGGAAETHERMQESMIRFDEELRRRGKRLAELQDVRELLEIARLAGMGRSE